MKPRKFFPTQHFFSLDGKRLSGLNTAELALYSYSVRRSRKRGVLFAVVSDTIRVFRDNPAGYAALESLRKTIASSLGQAAQSLFDQAKIRATASLQQ